VSTDTSPDPQEKPRQQLLSMLPRFAAPPQTRLDPALPTVEESNAGPSSNPSPSTAPTSPVSPSSPLEQPSPSGAADPWSPATGTSGTDDAVGRPRRRLKAGGDPAEVARAIAGVLLVVTGSLAWTARQRGRWFRQPTPKQRDDIARPLARAAVRHLPLDLIGPTFADLAEAAVATHDYAMDGPLITDPPVDGPVFADEYDLEETR
jgi:hypothetical protein